MFAPKLQSGNTIGVVAPSTPVAADAEAQLATGVAYLERLGFKVVFGRHVRSTRWDYAASPQEKAEDINQMFADPAIHAIICARGGETANASLLDLAWDVIRAHPKIFMGLSDITVLLNAIYHQTGLITFHGADMIWGFGRNATAYDEQEFRAILLECRIGAIPPNGERQTIRSGAAEGRLLGGNLRCLLKLAGTPFFPDFTDAIFCVEALKIPPEGCDALFQQLKQMGVFGQIRGAIVGYIDGLQKDPQALQMEDILLRITAEYEFPILKVNDFGHNCPNAVLPIGGNVRLDADARTIEVREACVT